MKSDGERRLDPGALGSKPHDDPRVRAAIRTLVAIYFTRPRSNSPRIQEAIDAVNDALAGGIKRTEAAPVDAESLRSQPTFQKPDFNYLNQEVAALCAGLFLLNAGVGSKTDAMRRAAQARGFDIDEHTYKPGVPSSWRELIHWNDYQKAIIFFVDEGWHDGRDVLCNLAEACIKEGEPVPVWLVEFLIRATRDGTKALREKGRANRKGPNPYAKVNRDHAIAAAVRFIVDRTNYPATRAYGSKTKPSACSVVAEALQMLDVFTRGCGETTVNAIWSETKGATKGLFARPLKRARVSRRVSRRPPGGGALSFKL
jgi:hypothetical protein